VDQHFHNELGCLGRLIHLGILLVFCIEGIVNHDFVFPMPFTCTLVLLLKRKIKKGEKDKKRKERNREVMNKVVGIGLLQ